MKGYLILQYVVVAITLAILMDEPKATRSYRAGSVVLLLIAWPAFMVVRLYNWMERY